jgi:hypothetical protein
MTLAVIHYFHRDKIIRQYDSNACPIIGSIFPYFTALQLGGLHISNLGYAVHIIDHDLYFIRLGRTQNTERTHAVTIFTLPGMNGKVIAGYRFLPELKLW